jgi:hypothetical protein
MTLVAFVSRCAVHEAANASMADVLAENLLKCKAQNIANALAFPNPDAKDQPKINVTWSLDANRNAHIQMTGDDVTPALRIAVAAALQAQIGAAAILD